MTYEMSPHQAAAVYYAIKDNERPYIMLIGGFGAGKSMTDVFLLLTLIELHRADEQGFNIGLVGVTAKLLKRTVLKDLKLALTQGGIPFNDNSQTGVVTIGNLVITYLGMENPDDIFAHNFNCVLVDELDELPVGKVLEVMKAVQERNRLPIPGKYARDPFVFISTTAQGLGGTYMFMQTLKEKGEKYAVIHARTTDNKYIARSQLKRLEALYSPEEKAAFLEGKFVNLAKGKVYPDFVRNRNTYMPFPVDADEVYYGQDFNYSWNVSVACVVRGEHIYVVDAAGHNTAGDSFGYHRKRFPNAHIYCIPDASGKNILTGFAEEAERNLIEFVMNVHNPSVAERIWAINILFRQGRLHVFDVAENARLILGLETRGTNDQGKPEKGGIDANDHYCDSLEYAVWHIIHTKRGFESVLEALRSRYHRHDGEEE